VPDILPVSLQDVLYSWEPELRAYEIVIRCINLGFCPIRNCREITSTLERLNVYVISRQFLTMSKGV